MFWQTLMVNNLFWKRQYIINMKLFFNKQITNFNLLINNNLKSLITYLSILLFAGILLFVFGYVTPLIFKSDLSALDKIVSLLLLASFVYSGLHCVGYVDHFLKSLILYEKQFVGNLKHKIKFNEPSVAIIIPTLNEEPDMVRKTIQNANNINYNNYQTFLIDSSTNKEIQQDTKVMCQDLGVNYIYRDNLRGYKAGSINDCINSFEDEYKYVMILDSDHRLKNCVLQDLIPIMENDPNLTFIQTPQYFGMNKDDPLSLAYSFQQHIFYKHICRGLCVNNSTFICGTNVLIKLDHLKEIGGMDEKCITEDVATSFNLHTAGSKSLYIDKVYAEGLPPASLSAYFSQQLRWSYGTLQNSRRVLSKLISEPASLKSMQWFEYTILMGTWYFMGLATLVWLIYPIAVLLFNLKPLLLGFWNIPMYIFIVMILTQVLTSVRERGYPVGQLFLSQAVFISLFPVYIRAFVYGMTNKKLGFKVTSKKKAQKIKLREITPHIFITILLVISIIMGLEHMNQGDNLMTYPSIIFWASYNVVMLLLFLLYFYRQDTIKYISQKDSKSVEL